MRISEVWSLKDGDMQYESCMFFFPPVQGEPFYKVFPTHGVLSRCCRMSRWTIINLPGSCSCRFFCLFCSIVSETEGLAFYPGQSLQLLLIGSNLPSTLRLWNRCMLRMGNLAQANRKETSDIPQKVDAWNDWKDRPEQNVLWMQKHRLMRLVLTLIHVWFIGDNVTMFSFRALWGIQDFNIQGSWRFYQSLMKATWKRLSLCWAILSVSTSHLPTMESWSGMVGVDIWNRVWIHVFNDNST